MATELNVYFASIFTKENDSENRPIAPKHNNYVFEYIEFNSQLSLCISE